MVFFFFDGQNLINKNQSFQAGCMFDVFQVVRSKLMTSVSFFICSIFKKYPFRLIEYFCTDRDEFSTTDGNIYLILKVQSVAAFWAMVTKIIKILWPVSDSIIIYYFAQV